MRLVILTQYFPPEMGAPQSRLYELACGLRALNWDVDVITAMPNYPTGKIFGKYRGKFTSRETHDDIPVKRFWLFPSNSRRAFPRLVSMLSFSITALFSLPFLYRRKPDFIFVESPPLTLALSALLMSRITGSKFVLNSSDLWPLSAKELGAIDDGFIYRRIEALEKFLYKKAFICTGQSQEIVDHVSKTKAARVFLFRNGVETKRFIPKTYNGNGVGNRLVYAGLLGVAQGIFDLCRNVNFKGLGAEFHIYGSGIDKENIEKYLSQNPNSNIFLHPAVNRDEIPGVLSRYDAALIPLVRKIRGAVPSKIYEAMAAGLPIVFSGEGEAAEIIKGCEVGWVSKANEFEELERNIAHFVRDGDRQRRYSANGVVCASRFFERGTQIQNLSDFLISQATN